MDRDVRDEASLVFLLDEPCGAGRPIDIRAGVGGAEAAGVERFADDSFINEILDFLVGRVVNGGTG